MPALTLVLFAMLASSSVLPAAASSAGSDGSHIVVRRGADGMLTFTGGSRTSQRGSASRLAALVPRQPPTELAALFSREATRNGLDRRLVEAVSQIESAFDQAALSSKGAIGLMQLMPDTARDLGVTDPWDAAQNIAGGSRYLRQMLDRFGGQLEHALAAYNAGPSAVERFGGIPPYRETIDYVKKVIGVYRGEIPRIEPASGRAGTATRTAPIRVERDANGHLVMTTP